MCLIKSSQRSYNQIVLQPCYEGKLTVRWPWAELDLNTEPLPTKREKGEQDVQNVWTVPPCGFIKNHPAASEWIINK